MFPSDDDSRRRFSLESGVSPPLSLDPGSEPLRCMSRGSAKFLLPDNLCPSDDSLTLVLSCDERPLSREEQELTVGASRVAGRKGPVFDTDWGTGADVFGLNCPLTIRSSGTSEE